MVKIIGIWNQFFEPILKRINILINIKTIGKYNSLSNRLSEVIDIHGIRVWILYFRNI